MALSLVQRLFITHPEERIHSRRALPASAMFPLSFSNALVSKEVKDKLVRVKAHENGPDDM